MLRLSMAVVFVFIGIGPGVASADVTLGLRGTFGGGAGSAARPVYGGSAGLDVGVGVGNGWAIGVSVDRVVLERPGKSGEGEAQVNFTANYSKRLKQFNLSSAFGVGLRRFKTRADDPLAGTLTLTGINLIHYRMGLNRELFSGVRLGFLFEWTMGGYVTSRYDNPEAYVSAYDRPPPELDGWMLGGGSSIYTFGPRVSAVFD